MRTAIDQIAEITVSTSNAGASIGGGASQMVLSTKSGSNTFHGAAYWYNRNSALAANDWFNNQAGVKRSFLDMNQVGASLGGHIIKDKLFFYVNPEFYRDKEQSSRLRPVLTDDAKAGILTYRDTAGSHFLKTLSPPPPNNPPPATMAMLAPPHFPPTPRAAARTNTTS